jgi:hypothetical protein
MKTQKFVIHGSTIAEAQTAIDRAAANIEYVRSERHGTKTRLFGPTGAAVVEFRASSWVTCICTDCVTARKARKLLEKQQALIKARGVYLNSKLLARQLEESACQ